MTLPVAREPRADVLAQRFLLVDCESRALSDHRIRELPAFVQPGDVWVVNDAATLPASLAGRADGRAVELRLSAEGADGCWQVVLFGEGSWREDTDRRPAPPLLHPGDMIELGEGLFARIVRVDPRSPRLLDVRFQPGGDAFWRTLYRIGRPIQYSYLNREMQLGELSTSYGGRPWAVELPSAGRPLTLGLIRALSARGADVVALTHAAGLSATGDPRLDRLLPLPERYDIPERTVRTIARARSERRRIVAVGTSVTRALEGCAKDHGQVRAGVGETDLILGADTERKVVDVLLTGAHDPSSSHYSLLRAFASDALLARAVAYSEAHDYLGHELGDSWLVVSQLDTPGRHA